MSTTIKEAKCVACGCSDSMACPSGCYWLVVDRRTGKGVCSNCKASVKTFRRKKVRRD
jgi:hypothetical protein